MTPETFAHMERLCNVDLYVKLPDGQYFRPEGGWAKYVAETRKPIHQ